MSRVLDLIESTAWAMEPRAFEALLKTDFEALSTRPALYEDVLPADEKRRTRGAFKKKGKTAIVPVKGALVSSMSFMDWLMGASSYASIVQALQAAVEDESIESILLDIDSPGGEVDGASDTASFIASIPKPVRAFASGDCCSAAYWLASAAGEVWAAPSSRLGSIGVRTTQVDASQHYAEKGIRFITLTSKGASRKALDMTSPEGVEAVQGLLDGMEAVFVSDVARNRRLPESTVLSAEWGQGFPIMAEAAVRVRMADRLAQSLADMMDDDEDEEETHTPLRMDERMPLRRAQSNQPVSAGPTEEEAEMPQPASKDKSTGAGQGAGAAEEVTKASEPVTVASLKAAHPDLVASIEAEANPLSKLTDKQRSVVEKVLASVDAESADVDIKDEIAKLDEKALAAQDRLADAEETMRLQAETIETLRAELGAWKVTAESQAALDTWAKGRPGGATIASYVLADVKAGKIASAEAAVQAAEAQERICLEFVQIQGAQAQTKAPEGKPEGGKLVLLPAADSTIEKPKEEGTSLLSVFHKAAGR